MEKSIEVVGFDADDTLWHNETLYSRVKDQFQELLAPYSSPEQARRELDEIEEWNVRYYGYGIKSFALSMVEAAIRISGGHIAPANLSRILDAIKEMLNAKVEPFEQVEATLTELAQHFPLMLITKGDYFEQQHKIDRSGLAGYFRYTEIVVDKTPEAYRSVLAKYHLEPTRFLMVGNSLRSDILPVLAIGGQAVYVPYANTWAHEQAEIPAEMAQKFIEIENLGQLSTLLTSL